MKTIISVDGAKPDLKSARKQGIRNVHIPIGYTGVPEHAALARAGCQQGVPERPEQHLSLPIRKSRPGFRAAVLDWPDNQ